MQARVRVCNNCFGLLRRSRSSQLSPSNGEIMRCNCPFKVGINPTNVVGGYPNNLTQGFETVNHDQEPASEGEAIAPSTMLS